MVRRLNGFENKKCYEIPIPYWDKMRDRVNNLSLETRMGSKKDDISPTLGF